MFLMAAAAATAAAASPTISTTMRSSGLAVSATTSSMSRCGVFPWSAKPDCEPGEGFGLARRTRHDRFAGLLRREAQRKPGRPEEAHQRDRERKHRHEDNREDHDIAKAAQ